MESVDNTPNVTVFEGGEPEGSIEKMEVEGGGSGEVSRLQIVRTPPPSYAGPTLTDNDFFVSFGLYNGMVPTGIDNKITISTARHVYLEITVSSTNPGYASAVKISDAAAAPVNTEPAAGVWPTTVYVPLGKIEDVDGSWVITNYDNGNVGGAVFAGIFDVNTDGTVETSYSFIAARF